MIAEKTAQEIAKEIQKELTEKGYPVKVSFIEPKEGADIGIKLQIGVPRDWELEKKIGLTVWSILDKHGLIAFIEKKWS